MLIKILTLNIAYFYYPKTDSNGVPYKNEKHMLFVDDHLITTASDIALLQEVDKFTDRRGFLRIPDQSSTVVGHTFLYSVEQRSR